MGLVADQLNTKQMLYNTLNIKKEKKVGSQVAIYANQWQFRSTWRLVHNANFYSNIGSLDGNELIHQFTEVVMSYENIGVKICGSVIDGGGGILVFCTLWNNLPIYTHWPGDASIRSLNPVDTPRYVYFISCSTHGLKAIRNSLFHS